MEMVEHRCWPCQDEVLYMSRQSRNVAFSLSLLGVRLMLQLPVKQRRALLASNSIKE
jgi:hypothetical protein